MLSAVTVRSFDAPEYNEKEILHYARAREATHEISKLVKECLAEAEGKLTYKVCYREFPIKRMKNALDLTFAVTRSRDLMRNLEECESIVLFAATVGLSLDRLVAKYARILPSKALIFQAIGAERIESLCDAFNREIATEKKMEGKLCRPRFSAGYGDLPIELQKEIFCTLDCQRKIGLTLNESFLMSPSKSVTAIIGIKEDFTLNLGEKQ